MVITRLFPHQKDIVKFCIDKPYFGIFADYGTGKTLCVLKMVDILKIRKTLVISTKTAIESTWVDEIREHTDFQYTMLTGLKDQRIKNLYFGLRKSSRDKPVIFLINLDGVKTICNSLIQADFDMIIVDESTKIKSPNTVRTRSIWHLGAQAPIKGILTGFPVTESLGDLYSQIKYLDNGYNLGNSWHAFMGKYFVKFRYHQIIKKKSIKEIVAKIKPFCIRVSDDVIKLPPRIMKKIMVDITDQQSDLLNQLNSEFRLEFGNVKIDTMYIFALINKSMQICNGFIQGETIVKNGKKIKPPIETVDTEKDKILLEVLEEIGKKRKVVVWFPFIWPLLKVEMLLKRFGYRVLTIHGSVGNINLIINQFQYGNYDVLLASLKKAAESITLSKCMYGIYYGNLHSGGIRGNSMARIRRIGTKFNSIMYIDLLVKGTIELDILNCLNSKQDLVTQLKGKFNE